MTISRRNFLRWGGIAASAAGVGVLSSRALGAAVGAPTASTVAGRAKRRISLRNLHTGEDLDVEYFRDGGYVADAMSAVEHVLRDFRNGERHPIDPCLMDYLHQVAGELGVDPQFGVISGYRSPQTNAQLRAHSSGVARNSLHMQGRAIDVRLAGINCADLAARAQPLRRGGVGYYRASDFVHLDTGACRIWHG